MRNEDVLGDVLILVPSVSGCRMSLCVCVWTYAYVCAICIHVCDFVVLIPCFLLLVSAIGLASQEHHEVSVLLLQALVRSDLP